MSSVLQNKIQLIKEVLKTETLSSEYDFTDDNINYDKDFVRQHENSKLSILNLLLAKSFYEFIMSQKTNELKPEDDESDDEKTDDEDDNSEDVDLVEQFEDNFISALGLIYDFCTNYRLMNVICRTNGFNSNEYYHDLVMYYLKYLELINKN